MAPVKSPSEAGHTLVQSLMGMLLCSLVLMVAFAAFAWVQASHSLMRSHADLNARLIAVLGMLRERVQRAGAPALQFNSQGQARLTPRDLPLSGSDNQLFLSHWRSLTPSDCQGHQASTLDGIQDDFKTSAKQEFSCKDSQRSNTSYQALVDGISIIQFRYAQFLPGPPPLMKWQSAAQVTNWQAIRGVQACVQTQWKGNLRVPLSRACNSSQNLNHAFAWRGVASLFHHP